MVNRITTLKTKGGDSVFPNVVEKNIPDSIARQSAVNKIHDDLENNYLTKAAASSTYQAKADMESYVTKTYGNAHYATAAQLANSVPDNIILYGDLTPVA